MNNITEDRYNGLDGLRACAAIGIVLMHVLANGNYALNGFIFSHVIPSFSDFTYLFMIVSAFSMCCGYYDGILKGTVTLESFYTRRYKKIWPFFAFLCTIEVIRTHTITAVYEYIADLTLVFGFIPKNNIQVIGVGWFLGTLFVFYMCFPFFCYLNSNKVRAWFAFFVSIVINVLCSVYFVEAADRENFIYSSMFFLAGGILYLYRKKLEKISRVYIALLGVLFIVLTAIVYTVMYNNVLILILFSIITVYFVSSNLSFWRNKTISFLSSISFEIYLCHMVIYRALEKMNLIHVFSSELISYIFTSILTIFGSIVFSFGYIKILSVIKERHYESAE